MVFESTSRQQLAGDRCSRPKARTCRKLIALEKVTPGWSPPAPGIFRGTRGDVSLWGDDIPIPRASPRALHADTDVSASESTSSIPEHGGPLSGIANLHRLDGHLHPRARARYLAPLPPLPALAAPPDSPHGCCTGQAGARRAAWVVADDVMGHVIPLRTLSAPDLHPRRAVEERRWGAIYHVGQRVGARAVWHTLRPGNCGRV